jgi:adenosylcobinamide-GDP ribazoletransferase
VALFLTTPYVRPGGLGSVLAQHMPRGACLAMLIGVAILSALGSGWTGVFLLCATAGVFLFLRWLMSRRLGGTTGDTAGALVEVTETIALVTAAVANG